MEDLKTAYEQKFSMSDLNDPGNLLSKLSATILNLFYILQFISEIHTDTLKV